MFRTNSLTLVFLLLLPTMSKACTTAIPEPSMVQSWRVNIMMSFELMLLPAVNSGLDFLRTRNGRIPCRRSSALIRLWLAARSSPLTRAPRLSVPSHLKVGSSGFALTFAKLGCLATTANPLLPD